MRLRSLLSSFTRRYRVDGFSAGKNASQAGSGAGKSKSSSFFDAAKFRSDLLSKTLSPAIAVAALQKLQRVSELKHQKTARDQELFSKLALETTSAGGSGCGRCGIGRAEVGKGALASLVALAMTGAVTGNGGGKGPVRCDSSRVVEAGDAEGWEEGER